MYSEKVRRMSRPLIAVLTLCLVFAMAPLLPMTNSDVDAAVKSLKLQYVDGDGNAKVFETWTYDAANDTYKDSSGKKVSVIKDFSANPYVYTALGGNLTVVTEGILIDDFYKYISEKAGMTLNSKSYFETSYVNKDGETVTVPLSTIDDVDRYYIPSVVISPGSIDSNERTAVPMVFATKAKSSEKGTYYATDQDLSTAIDALANAADSTDAVRNYQGIKLDPMGDDGIDDVEGNLGKISPRNIDLLTFKPVFNTISLDGNGGNAPAASVKRAVGEKYNLADATRTDYRFNGWFTAAKGGTKVDSSAVFTDGKDQTLFAQWTGTNKYLKSLKTSKGKLNKKFKKSKSSYTVKLKKKQSKTKITATKAQSTSKVQIKVGKGKWKTVKSATVKVKKGKTVTVKIKVTAQNKTTKTYTVKVKRAKK